ncbi:MAG TPA: FAD-dependent monooxygenase [Anaeromyxobacter sp.]
MTRVRDAVVVGGGPAGLAFAAHAAGRGLDVLVLERREGPLDKACGEGILPAGVRALAPLGVLERIPAEDRATLRAIRWVDPAAGEARLALPEPFGLAVRRTALSAALLARAREAGAEVIQGAAVARHRREGGAVVVAGPFGEARGRLLVAADGLNSPTRRREGLDLPARAPRRYGLRRHYAVAPWSEDVEVHFGPRAEAYVWPAGPARVGVAFLYEPGAPSDPRRIELGTSGEAAFHTGGPLGGLEAFPAIAARVAGAPEASAPRGAGPFDQAARARIADRLVLLGDAAGYVDAITGEGLSLAFGCAADLAALAPDAIACGAGTAALRPYERAWRRRFRPYAAWTRLLLALSRRPALRRGVLALAAARPGPFERIVEAAVG